ncbi:MAG TPA: CBS domain-containing protein [Chitinophagaceae bacterium]|nr:CBS domain-containing protein [Chitinophagaceae bacterium]
MEKITVILGQKESHFRYISPASSLDEALCRMSCENTDHLVVMDDDDNFMGVITEHDIASKAILEKISLQKVAVKKLVNRGLPIATTDDTVEQCLQRMQRHKVKLLPVFEGYTFKGIISSDDILREIASNRADIFDEDETPVIY